MGIINNKNIIYNNSKTFFWASIFLPKSVLNKVINIYSFCRTYDDIVDEGLPITSSQDAKKLEEIIRSYGISQNLIDELISGINSDVNFKRYKNNDELLRYCYKVAGVVGLMMSQALEIRNLEAKYFAIDLGIAMQLTNIARDISQDYDKNRIYLPEDTGISADIISNMTHDNKIKIEKSVNDLIVKADIFYNSSLNGLRYIPIKSRFSILIALRIYQAIGHKIKRTGTKFLKENIYITSKEKIFLIIKSIIEFFIFFILPFHRRKHNKCLHEPLSGLADADTK